VTDEKKHHQPFPETDGRQPGPQPTSYTMVHPRFREIYFQFYKETYKPSVLDRKTKELVAIAASLAAKCQGCLEGHVKKALKFGATRDEVSEAIAIAIGVNAAAIVDLTDIAADNMDLRLFPGPDQKPGEGHEKQPKGRGHDPAVPGGLGGGAPHLKGRRKKP
jgi:AhpD family alkylhydroperoxidase